MLPERNAAGGAPADCDVAVVGAGPAGLGAATRLRALGVERVVVLDREPAAGGIPRHCGHYPFGMREFRRLLRGPDYAARLVAAARAAGVGIRTATTVTGIERGPCLALADAGGTGSLRARRVVLATGVRESSRAARLLGGQRPLGVIPTGALQSMVYLEDLRPFRRPVILGTELVSFSAILTCRHAGIRPVAMLEEGERITARAAAAGLPVALGIPLLLGTRVERIEGDRRVQAVHVRGADGARQRVDCDGVIVSGRFVPEATLPRSGHLAVDAGTGGPAVDQYARCSDPDFFAAGNLLRPVETAGWSWREGVDVAARVAASLRGELPDPAGPWCPVTIDGEALRYALPQRLALPCVPPRGGRAGHVQVRVARAASGRLSLRAGGRGLWSRRTALLPERRILVPLAPLAGVAPGTDIRITMTEE